jgi:hypothetical protein
MQPSVAVGLPLQIAARSACRSTGGGRERRSPADRSTAALALEVRLVCSPAATTEDASAASIDESMSVLEANVAVFTVPEYDSTADLCDGRAPRHRAS